MIRGEKREDEGKGMKWNKMRQERGKWNIGDERGLRAKEQLVNGFWVALIIVSAVREWVCSAAVDVWNDAYYYDQIRAVESVRYPLHVAIDCTSIQSCNHIELDYDDCEQWKKTKHL